ncbi:MAG: threonine--tRNA ligase, partial [Anaerolineales bacterium]|nr:threonine--tRNA ligase [Anaerolineales bacterium]
MAEQKEERYEESELYRLRHSAAHVLAQAVMEMFPGETQIAIGPPIENGFYYDFGLPRSLLPEDLRKLEKRMRQIIAGNHEFARSEASVEQARQQFAQQEYKLELIEELAGGDGDEAAQLQPQAITFYTHDTFTDLCRGPHIGHTGQINPAALKLLNVAGAYWRGDENNAMLQRVYGTAWRTVDELKQHLWQLEEAKKRDHRK